MAKPNHLHTLRRYFERHGEFPSASAMPLLLDCAEDEAQRVVSEMLAAGHLCERDGELAPGEAFGPVATALPLASESIPAGYPEAIAEPLRESVDIHAYLAADSARSVVVPVAGDSMQGAGIADGDLAVIDLAATPRPGDIVAAEIDGQFTLKRLAVEAGGYVLRAENPKYPDLRARESLRIHGVLVGLARRY